MTETSEDKDSSLTKLMAAPAAVATTTALARLNTDNADLRTVELIYLFAKLKECNWNKKITAKKLGISRSAFYAKLKRAIQSGLVRIEDIPKREADPVWVGRSGPGQVSVESLRPKTPVYLLPLEQANDNYRKAIDKLVATRSELEELQERIDLLQIRIPTCEREVAEASKVVNAAMAQAAMKTTFTISKVDEAPKETTAAMAEASRTSSVAEPADSDAASPTIPLPAWSKFKTWRLKHGWSTKHIGVFLGIPEDQVDDYEAGREIPLSLLAKIRELQANYQSPTYPTP